MILERDQELDKLGKALATLQLERDTLLWLIMSRTDICPFGGGKQERRIACRFGYPGCACWDYAMAMEDAAEMANWLAIFAPNKPPQYESIVL